MLLWFPVLWIFSLAILSVGARNFEDGLSIDGPLYATISRNMARTGEWFYMRTDIPHFNPFAEHPHLGFWLQALIFRILPIADWSARLSGHLFYVGFLYLFYMTLAKVYSQRTGVLGVLFLWIWGSFSNYFSNFYLDPAALFFGSLFLYSLWKGLQSQKYLYFMGAGVSLGLAFLSKGLLALGFGPAAAGLVLFYLKKHRFQGIRNFLGPVLVLVAGIFVLMLYVSVLKNSSVPQFIELYFSNQMTQRFGRSWTVGGLSNYDFWYVLLKHSHWLILLTALIFPLKIWKQPSLGFVGLWFFTFVLMFAPAFRIGAQYLLFLLPCIAWVLAVVVNFLLPSKFDFNFLVKWSGFLSILALCLVQYLPIRTHGRSAPPETALIKEFYEQNQSLERYLLFQSDHSADKNFLNLAAYAWYGDLKVTFQVPPDYQGLGLIFGKISKKFPLANCKIKTFGNRHLVRFDLDTCNVQSLN